MWLYLMIFIIPVLFYLGGKKRYNQNTILLGIYMILLAFFIGLGDMIGGYDRYIYSESFDTIADELHGTKNLNNVVYLIEGHEYGYFLWQVVVACFTSNRYIYILVTTLSIYVLYFYAFKKYIKDYPLAVILFLGLFYYFTMTYLRQVIACGIIWLSLIYIWQRKPIKFFVMVLLAYSFHNSAIVFAPMYFIPIRLYSKQTIMFILFACLFVGLTALPNIIMSSGDSRLSTYAEQDQGFRIEYVLEVLFFVWLFFKNYKFIHHDKMTLTMLNMSFVFCCFLLLFIRFGQGGRMGWYYFMGIIYTVTTLCNRPKAFYWMRPLTIATSLALFMRITISWAALNVPYKTFLTDGEPAGNGTIYRQYEYNENYTINKFCRKAWDPVL